MYPDYENAQKTLEGLTSQDERAFSDEGIITILSAISPDAIKDLPEIIKKYDFIFIKENRVSDKMPEIKAFFKGFLGDYNSGDPLDKNSYWIRMEEGAKALDRYEMKDVYPINHSLG